MKWSAWPETAWQWVHICDMDAMEKVSEFRRAMLKVIPFQDQPKRVAKQKNYSIKEEYKLKIITEYKQQKDVLRKQLLKDQDRVRKIDPLVLIENEEDLAPFPTQQKYQFLKDTVITLPDQEKNTIHGKNFTKYLSSVNSPVLDDL